MRPITHRSTRARATQRAVAAAVVVTVGSLLSAAPATASIGAVAAHRLPHVELRTPPAPGDVAGHLLAISPSAGKVSAFSAADLTALEASQPIKGNVSVATAPTGAIEVAARNPEGQVLLFTSVPGAPAGSAKGWTQANLSTLATAPAAAGDPDVVVDQAGVVRVFYRTGTGQLEELENDRRDAEDPWFGSDLTSLTSDTLGLSISGDPVAMSAPGYPVQVYARATNGDLIGFSLTTIALHPWYYENLTELALGPTVIGIPAPVPAPDGEGWTAVYAVTNLDQLVEFTDDDAGWHTWSVRDVSSALRLPPVASSPTVLPGDPVDVATVSTAGHALVVSIPTVTLAGGHVQDVSAMTDQRVEPRSTTSIVRASPGYELVAVSPQHHLVVFSVPGAAATTAKVTDATMQSMTEQLIAGFPVAVRTGGADVVLAASGGLIGLISRIVLDAESQDQFHAAVVDTPWNTNCNPYTAAFGRGTTAGCAPGTAAEEWCSDFADWVWTVAGVDTTGIDGASKTFVTWGKGRGQFLQGISSQPAVGDAVVWGVLNPLWGAHVGIVVGVRGDEIDVVSGNAGGGRTSGVFDSGLFAPSTQTAQGDPIIGYVSPVPLTGGSSSSARQ